MAAIGWPMVLATNGTVRLARGLTSSTKMRGLSESGSSMANCTFISPRTFSARAMASVWRFSSAMVSGRREKGGREQALSPECTPASSICSITPGDEHRLAVAEGVDVHLGGAGEVLVDQHRGVARDLHGMADVARQLLFVAHDLHGPAAQDVGGPDHHREARPPARRRGPRRHSGRWRSPAGRCRADAAAAGSVRDPRRGRWRPARCPGSERPRAPGRARGRRGVCPPNWTMTPRSSPAEASTAISSSTSSAVRGSK